APFPFTIASNLIGKDLTVRLGERLSWFFIPSLVVQFLLPRSILAFANLDNRTTQLALCAGAGICLTAWLLNKLKPMLHSSIAICLCIGVILTFCYIGLLETAQVLTPDRHARLSDFELNAWSVTAAIAVYGLLVAGMLGILRIEAKKREEPFS